jgi:hypothetical protein
MEKFNSKGTKCPTLWLGTDKMTQNKAKTFVLELTNVRPDLEDKNSEGVNDDLHENDKQSDINFCQKNSTLQKIAISQIVASLLGILNYLH